MSKIYSVGRSANALIRIPKQHDTVGKMHLEIEDMGQGLVTITDLNSTNGTFLRVAGKWEKLDAPRVVSVDVELLLGNHRTTPRRLLSAIVAPPPSERAAKPGPTLKQSPLPPVAPDPPQRRSSGMRRNEFGEIVPE